MWMVISLFDYVVSLEMVSGRKHEFKISESRKQYIEIGMADDKRYLWFTEEIMVNVKNIETMTFKELR